MVAPAITFYTGAGTTETVYAAKWTGSFMTGSFGAMATIHDYGTIDTGSSGSTLFFWIWNNSSGSLAVADAILSSSGQTYGGTDQLGLGEHASGSADHNSSGVLSGNDLQSGSLTGSVWISSSYYYRTSQGYSGSVGSSGSLSKAFMNPMSGSAALGSRRLSLDGFVLSGASGDAGRSGSGWLIASYINVLNGTPQGSRTGSFCLRFKYT